MMDENILPKLDIKSEKEDPHRLIPIIQFVLPSDVKLEEEEEGDNELNFEGFENSNRKKTFEFEDDEPVQEYDFEGFQTFNHVLEEVSVNIERLPIHKYLSGKDLLKYQQRLKKPRNTLPRNFEDKEECTKKQRSRIKLDESPDAGAPPLARRRRGIESLLTKVEESLVVDFAVQMQGRGLGVTRKSVLDLVGVLLRRKEEKWKEIIIMRRRRRKNGKTWGMKKKRRKGRGWWVRRRKRKRGLCLLIKAWYEAFLRRHPVVEPVTKKALALARMGLTEEAVRGWFARLEVFLEGRGLAQLLRSPSRIFALQDLDFPLHPNTGGERYVSVLATASANGLLPPPMVMYRQQLPKALIHHLPQGATPIVLGRSDSGRLTNECLYEYLCNDFSGWLSENSVQRPVLMFTDWLPTVADFHLYARLKNLQIIPYGLPPDSSPLLHPIEVGLSSPLKSAWIQSADRWRRAESGRLLSQVTFAKVFMPVYHQICSVPLVKEAFRLAGLSPYNPHTPDYTKLPGYADGTRNIPTNAKRQSGRGKYSQPKISDKASPRKVQNSTTSHKWSPSGALDDLVLSSRSCESLRSSLRERWRSFETQEGLGPPPKRKASPSPGPRMTRNRLKKRKI